MVHVLTAYHSSPHVYSQLSLEGGVLKPNMFMYLLDLPTYVQPAILLYELKW